MRYYDIGSPVRDDVDLSGIRATAFNINNEEMPNAVAAALLNWCLSFDLILSFSRLRPPPNPNFPGFPPNADENFGGYAQFPLVKYYERGLTEIWVSEDDTVTVRHGRLWARAGSSNRPLPDSSDVQVFHGTWSEVINAITVAARLLL